jgi:hypothetical protein
VIFGEAAVVSITANQATSIDHNYSGSLDSLDITANSATTVNVGASDVTGATTIDSGANTTVSVTSDLADVTITDGLTVTLSGDISGTATMNPAATASVTLSGSTVNDLDVNSGATYDIDANLTTVDFVAAGSSVDITGDISGAANFALASGDLTITGDLGAAINVTGETAENVTITGDITGAAAFAMADGGALSITGDLTTSLTVSDDTASTVTVDGAVGGAVTIAPKDGAEISITGALADALTISGDASSVTLGGTVTGVATVSIADDATFTSSGGFASSLSIDGGDDINLNGTADADGAVSIVGVAATGDITISNELQSSLTIVGSDLITYTGAAIDGAVSVNMTDTGAFVATSLTSLGNTVSIDGATITAGSLASISGAATFANVDALTLNSLTSAAAGITANSATTARFSSLASAMPFEGTSVVSFIAGLYDVTASLNLGDGAAVTVKSVTTGQMLDPEEYGSLNISAQARDFDSATFTGLTSIDITPASNSINADINGDNADLASLTFRGSWDTVTVGSGVAGLGSLESFTTASGSTLKTLVVQNTTALEGVNFNHSEDSPDGISITIDSNAALTSFTTSADRVYEFIVTDNAALASFDASSYTNIPADTDSDAAGDDVAFDFTVTGNALTGSKVDNDATNEQSFTQASLSTIRDYILAAFAGVAADAANATNNGSSISVDLSYLVGAVPVQTDDGTGTGSIDDQDEVAAIN